MEMINITTQQNAILVESFDNCHVNEHYKQGIKVP